MKNSVFEVTDFRSTMPLKLQDDPTGELAERVENEFTAIFNDCRNRGAQLSTGHVDKKMYKLWSNGLMLFESEDDCLTFCDDLYDLAFEVAGVKNRIIEGGPALVYRELPFASQEEIREDLLEGLDFWLTDAVRKYGTLTDYQASGVFAEDAETTMSDFLSEGLYARWDDVDAALKEAFCEAGGSDI